MVIAGIKHCSITDGPGRRFVVLLPGCQHHCAGCAASQGPGSGVDFPMEELADQMDSQDTEGLTLTGGDPFDQPEACAALAKAAHAQGKTVWCWTSRTFEDLAESGSPAQQALLKETDVLVDGPFRADLARDGLLWRSSGNQRCIRVPDSFAAGKAVLLPENSPAQ